MKNIEKLKRLKRTINKISISRLKKMLIICCFFSGTKPSNWLCCDYWLQRSFGTAVWYNEERSWKFAVGTGDSSTETCCEFAKVCFLLGIELHWTLNIIFAVLLLHIILKVSIQFLFNRRNFTTWIWILHNQHN